MTKVLVIDDSNIGCKIASAIMDSDMDCEIINSYEESDMMAGMTDYDVFLEKMMKDQQRREYWRNKIANGTCKGRKRKRNRLHVSKRVKKNYKK